MWQWIMGHWVHIVGGLVLLSVLIAIRVVTRSNRYRHIGSRLVLLIVLVLSAGAVWLSLYIDNTRSGWLELHPVTANLIASALALPAAFLIVNLAAERAVKWGEATRWDRVLGISANAICDTWEECREGFLKHYWYFPKIGELWSGPEYKDSTIYLADDLRELANLRFQEGDDGQQYVRAKELVTLVTTPIALLLNHFDNPDEEVYLTRLKTALGRFEARLDDPDVIALIHQAEDSLFSLDAKWIHARNMRAFSHFENLKTSAALPDFPQPRSDWWNWRQSLIAIVEILDAAQAVFVQMDRLTSRIDRHLYELPGRDRTTD